MERKQIRRLLHRWGRTQQTCAERSEQIEQFEALLMKSEVARRNNENGRKNEERYARLAQEYSQTIERLTRECEEELRFARTVDGLLRELEPLDRRLLELRYQKGLSWIQVARGVHYSVDRTKHKDAELADRLAEAIRISI